MTFPHGPQMANMTELREVLHRHDANEKIQQESQTMLSMARSAGIELKENPDYPGELRGNCPFHKPPVSTFAINVQKGRFHCIYCRRAGGADSLAAHLWKVSTADAHHTLQSLETPAPGRRPLPLQPPPNPNSAIANRLMTYFNRDLAINRNVAYICKSLGLVAKELANRQMGWSWPGRPMDELMEQDITAAEMPASDLLLKEEKGNWTTAMPDGLVIADLDPNGAARQLISYDDIKEKDYYPSERRPPTIGIQRLHRHEAVIHLTDDPLVYLKAVELDLPAVLTCNGEQTQRAAREILAKQPGAIALYSSYRRIAEPVLDRTGIAQAATDRKLSRFRYLLPRRMYNLRMIRRKQTANGTRRKA